MKNNKIYRYSILLTLPIGLLFFLIVFAQKKLVDSIDYQSNTVDRKQRGAHIFGRVDSTNFQLLNRNNIEWITLVPWSGQADYDSPILRHHRGDSLRMQRRDSSWISRIELARSAGFKVFVKPHVWIDAPSNGKWRSDIYPSNNENWELWKKSYRDFILRYAHIAQQANAEMYCIGTEFTRLSIEKPAFWKALIQEVRGIYSGKITYAANWHNEYENITFWEDLDYIGIQAYFPLVKNKYPSVRQISKGWNKYISSIKSIQKKYHRKIIFTEMGYKSTADSAISPWEWIDHTKPNKSLSTATQANCYEAFFKTIWQKDWFAGVHIWHLRSDYSERDSPGNHLDFIPQGKPAEGVIAEGFE